MRFVRLGVGAVLVGVLVCVAAGEARAQIVVPPGENPPAQKAFFDRDSVLTAVTIVDVAAAGWTAYSFASGNHSGTADAVIIIGTAPSVIFGAAVLGHDSNDPALWVGTLAAGALLTIATVDIFRESAKPSDQDNVRSFSNLMVIPRVEPMPNEGSTRVSLALAGTF